MARACVTCVRRLGIRGEKGQFQQLAQEMISVSLHELCLPRLSQLSCLSIRAGTRTKQELYPFAFDPQTRLVVIDERKLMLGMKLQLIRGRFARFLTVLLLFVFGCSDQGMPEQERDLQLYQKWELQPGDRIAGYPVASGLGDISIALNGNSVYAPFDGRVQPNKANCAIFSSEEVPSYLFRLCGLKSYHFGLRRAGEVIGKGNNLHFAVLNQQADGRWAMVEPSKKILEQILQPK